MRPARRRAPSFRTGLPPAPLERSPAAVAWRSCAAMSSGARPPPRRRAVRGRRRLRSRQLPPHPSGAGGRGLGLAQGHWLNRGGLRRLQARPAARAPTSRRPSRRARSPWPEPQSCWSRPPTVPRPRRSLRPCCATRAFENGCAVAYANGDRDPAAPRSCIVGPGGELLAGRWRRFRGRRCAACRNRTPRPAAWPRAARSCTRSLRPRRPSWTCRGPSALATCRDASDNVGVGCGQSRRDVPWLEGRRERCGRSSSTWRSARSSIRCCRARSWWRSASAATSKGCTCGPGSRTSSPPAPTGSSPQRRTWSRASSARRASGRSARATPSRSSWPRNGLQRATGLPAGGGVCADWRIEVTSGHGAIGSIGRVFDLLVVGRPLADSVAPSMAALETALFESGRPLLIAPPTKPTIIGDNILIAWNCSTETARTVAFAMPLLTQAKHITVVSVQRETVPGPERRRTRPQPAAPRPLGRVARGRAFGPRDRRRHPARGAACRRRPDHQGRLHPEPAATDDLRRRHQLHPCRGRSAGDHGQLKLVALRVSGRPIGLIRRVAGSRVRR